MTLAAEYRKAEDTASEALLLQKLVPVFEQLTSTLKQMKVDRLTLIGSQAPGPATQSVAPAVVQITEQVRAATGVDLLSVIGRRPLKGSK